MVGVSESRPIGVRQRCPQPHSCKYSLHHHWQQLVRQNHGCTLRRLTAAPVSSVPNELPPASGACRVIATIAPRSPSTDLARRRVIQTKENDVSTTYYWYRLPHLDPEQFK